MSLVLVQAGQKDQGLYRCCVKNGYGKATAELHLTTEGKGSAFRLQARTASFSQVGAFISTKGIFFCTF